MGVYLTGRSYYINFYEDGKRYTERVGQVSESVAKEKLAAKRSQVIRGEQRPKKVNTPFDKFKEQYLEWSKGNKKIDDWRAMVDCVMVDSNYNGSVFNIIASDVPEKKNDLVTGKYEFPASDNKTTVAVKIVDMLGEEVLITKEV